MEKLAHGIAVAIGFAVWTLSQNSIIAVIVALVAEGIIAVLLTTSKQANDKTKAQLAAWQTGEGSPPSARKLWWRIVILVVLAWQAVGMLIAVIMSTAAGDFEGEFFIVVVSAAIALTITELVVISSLSKALKWNKRLKLPPNSA